MPANPAHPPLTDTVAAVQARIVRACARVGRDPAGVTLIAVTKTQLVDRIAEAVAAGLTHFGENRVQEALAHFAWPPHSLPPGLAEADDGTPAAGPRIARAGLVLHLIGPLQRNKARRAAAFFDTVQTVDRLDLAATLDRHRAADRPDGPPLPVLIEVNISGEASKSGVRPADLSALAEGLRACPHLAPRGLMTVGAPGLDEVAARRQFATLRALRDSLAAAHPDQSWPMLSMGMTDDFEAAILEGATHIRLGRVLFGERF
jgi:pyridoxal phosphate enzyme (YggS family)